MKRSIFEGSAAAVVMLVNEYGNLDLDVTGRLLGQLPEERTDAVMVNGATGESATLDDNEKMEAIGPMIRHVNGKVPMIAGTGSNCIEHVVKLFRGTEKLGTGALLQVTPYYNKASQEGLARHLTQVGDRVRTPMILYNVPNHMGVAMQPEAYRILFEYLSTRGIEEVGGNMSMIVETVALHGDGFGIYSGNGDQTIPIMALRGEGVISMLANIMSKQTHGMCRLFLEGKLEESRKIQLYLLGIMEALFWDVNPVPVKAALSVMGMCMDSCYLPPTPMKAGEKTKLEAVMKRHR